MIKDPRPYYDPIIGKTMKQVYWIDGMFTFVPPNQQEKVKEEIFRAMSKTRPGRLEILS